MIPDPELEEIRQSHLKTLGALYNLLAGISEPGIGAGKRKVSLEQVAKVLDEKHLTFGANQGNVWRKLCELHDMGRIKLNPILEVAQQGKSLRCIELRAEFSFCRPPFKVPAKKDRYGWLEPKRDIAAAPITAREIKVLDSVLHLLRSGQKMSTKLSKAISELVAEEERNSQS